jgi:hypothetical protein
MAAQPFNNFYVFREDGTLIFMRDSTIAPYGFGEFSGSYVVRPVVNTNEGTKLFLAKLDNSGLYSTLDVYSLCGIWPQDVGEINTYNQISMQIYPNPMSGLIHFKYKLNSNLINYKLTICNSNSEIVKIIELSSFSNEFILENSNLPSGIYFYSLDANNSILQGGKFIVTN